MNTQICIRAYLLQTLNERIHSKRVCYTECHKLTINNKKDKCGIFLKQTPLTEDYTEILHIARDINRNIAGDYL